MKKLKELGDFSLLSIEDDAFNQELAIAVFDDIKNITIYRASDGKEGLDIIKQNSIDIILLDLLMPKMSGLELLKMLKESPIYNNIPIIIITSKADEKTVTYKLGADDFISKPYHPEELKLRVFNHLRIKKLSNLL
jgi:DNA-binding response OmpR family regulator